MKPARWELRDSRPMLSVDTIRKSELTAELRDRMILPQPDLWTPAQSFAALALALALITVIASITEFHNAIPSTSPLHRDAQFVGSLRMSGQQMDASRPHEREQFGTFAWRQISFLDVKAKAAERQRLLCELGVLSGPCSRAQFPLDAAGL